MQLQDLRDLTEIFDAMFEILEPMFIENLAPNKQGFQEKADNQLVGDFDRRVEEKVFEFLNKHFPDIAVVSEEAGGEWPPSEDTTWLLDPLDGTHNSLAGIPLQGSMLALILKREVAFSAIFLPMERKLGGSGLYIAGQNQGAWSYRNKKSARLTVSNESELDKAFILLEGQSKKIINFAAETKIAELTRRNRISLSACWTMTRVASGGLYSAGVDGAVIVDNKPWDNLPGCLLVEEAGGKVTDCDNNPWSVKNYSNLVLSNGKLHDQILKAIHQKVE